jgi:Flp pilus assembly protein TadD
MQQQKYDEASIRLGEAAKLDPANAEFANDAGYAFFKRGSYQMAVAWLDKATQLDPIRAVAYLNLGDALAKLTVNVTAREAYHANAEARQTYMKYLELAPDSKAAPDVKKKLAALAPSP